MDVKDLTLTMSAQRTLYPKKFGIQILKALDINWFHLITPACWIPLIRLSWAIATLDYKIMR